MNYPVILFDLDQTLFDTDKNAMQALRQLDLGFDFSFNAEHIADWNQLMRVMWAQFERKEMGRTELVDTRFVRYFDHYGISIADGHALDQQFQRLFFAQHALFPHAKEILADLKPDHHLAVISNGSKAKQDQQLTAAGIMQDFDQIFLAEDLGAHKPDPAFFKAVRRQLPDHDQADLVVIGDSLTADIQGANRANLASIWYNPDHLTNATAIRPTYEIDDLRQIPAMLTE